MRVDSLENLEVLFRDWRSKKRHVRERVPNSLLVRVQRAAAVYGVRAVVRASAIDYRRLTESMGGETQKAGRLKRQGGNATGTGGSEGVAEPATPIAAPMPAYSRIEFHAPETSAGPLAEVETPAGLRVRIFKITDEMVSLVSALSEAGRAP